MSAAIKVRVVVEIDLERGTQMLDACEIAESLSATLIQNIEVHDARLVAIERLPEKP